MEQREFIIEALKRTHEIKSGQMRIDESSNTFVKVLSNDKNGNLYSVGIINCLEDLGVTCFIEKTFDNQISVNFY